MRRGIAAQGVHGAGWRDYTPEQYTRVVEAVRRDGAAAAVTVAQVSEATGIPGRTVREIVSDADGVEFVLGGSGNGYQIATSPADAERITARILSQASRMRDRARRRMKAAANLAAKVA